MSVWHIIYICRNADFVKGVYQRKKVTIDLSKLHVALHSRSEKHSGSVVAQELSAMP